MTAPAPDFDAAREAYECARFERDRIIGNPDKTIPVNEYKSRINAAHNAVYVAHNTMMEAWG